jgi:hypothetical protein
MKNSRAIDNSTIINQDGVGGSTLFMNLMKHPTFSIVPNKQDKSSCRVHLVVRL